MEVKQNQRAFHGTCLNLTAFLFWSKYIKLFQWLGKPEFISFIIKVNRNNRNETNQIFSHWAYTNLTPDHFYQNILKYFSDFWNRNFSILWLKWTQKIKMEKYQTFFHGIYSNLTPFLSKHFKVFQWLSKSKFLIFMTKVNPNRGNETKSDIFLWDIFKIWHYFSMVKKY